MSYKFTTGSVRRGDIYFEDDRTGASTYIDFGQDTITLRPSGSAILYAEANAVGIGTTSPDNTLHVESLGTTHIKIASEAGYEAALNQVHKLPRIYGNRATHQICAFMSTART